MRQQVDEKQAKIPVVEILRVSTYGQAGDDKAGIPSQKANCAKIAKRENLEAVWFKQIEGVSGAAILRSPEMQDVLRIVRSGQCKGIVLSEESRLLRPENFEDYAILQLLEEYGVKLYLRDGVFDLSNASDKLFAHIKYAMAGYERTLIRDRMMGGKVTKRARGEWVYGEQAAPYGCTVVKRDGRNYLTVTHDAGNDIDQVVRLFKLFLSGTTNFGELQRLTGIPYHSISIILSNEIYTGWHVPSRPVDPRGKVYWKEGERAGRLRYQKRVKVPEVERLRIKMLDNPPIGEDTFRLAQNLLKLKREMQWKSVTDENDPFLYRGFLQCAICGRPLQTVRYSSAKYSSGGKFEAEYYQCKGSRGSWRMGEGWFLKPRTCKSPRMRRELVEALLDQMVIDRFSRPDLLEHIMEFTENVEGTESTTQQIERLELEIAETVRCLKRNAEMHIRGKITEEVFDNFERQLTLEKRASEAALSEIRPNMELVSPEMWAPLARQFQRWDRILPHQKRALLAAIAPVFIVSGEKVLGQHKAVITVKGCRLNLTGEQVDMSNNGLVDVTSPSGTALDINQSSIYIPF